jgi:hypothetical protein
MRQSWASIVDHNEREWGVSRKGFVSLLFAPVLVFLVFAIIRQVDRSHWREYWMEGGPAEWLQFFMLAFAVAFSLSIAASLMKQRSSLALLYVCLAAGLFFVAGEEIAWGQWLFGLSTPPGLVEINYKAELSVHNISSLVAAFDIGKLMLGAWGLLGGWVLLWLRRHGVQSLPEILVPPLFLGSWFLVVVICRLARLTFLRESVPVGFGEFEELCLYFGLMAYTVLVWRRVRVDATCQRSVAY